MPPRSEFDPPLEADDPTVDLDDPTERTLPSGVIVVSLIVLPLLYPTLSGVFLTEEDEDEDGRPVTLLEVDERTARGVCPFPATEEASPPPPLSGDMEVLCLPDKNIGNPPLMGVVEEALPRVETGVTDEVLRLGVVEEEEEEEAPPRGAGEAERDLDSRGARVGVTLLAFR